MQVSHTDFPASSPLDVSALGGPAPLDEVARNLPPEFVDVAAKAIGDCADPQDPQLQGRLLYQLLAAFAQVPA